MPACRAPLISHGALVATARPYARCYSGTTGVEREQEAACCSRTESRSSPVPAAASAGRSPSSSPREGARIAAFDRSREAGDELVAALEQAGRPSSLRRGRRARPGRRRARRPERRRRHRPDRRPRQLRRRARDRRRLHDARGGVGERDRDQPQRHVLLLPVGGAADARDGRRQHRQPRPRSAA